MSPCPFVHVVPSNEVVVGTCVDIAATTGYVPDQIFEDTEALVAQLQAFRSQEIIITFVSDDNELQRQWSAPYDATSTRPPRSSKEDDYHIR